MTQRTRIGHEETYSSHPIELHTRLAVSSEDLEDENIYPESNRAPLRNHRDGNDEAALSMSEPRPSTAQRFWNFMSRAPLLQKSTQSRNGPSYATISSEESSRRGSQDQGNVNQSKGKNPLLSKSASIAALRGNESHVHSGSSSQHQTRERRSLPSFVDGIAVPIGDGSRLSEDVGPFLVEDALDESAKSNDAILDVETDQDENPPDNSPFPQVRASVSATDNTALSICTPRMWILSLFFAFLGSATNLFFSLRYPSVAITPIIALVLVHPLGRLWDFALKLDDDPKESFEHGHRVYMPCGEIGDNVNDTWLRRLRLWLAQGKWNEKEHAMYYAFSKAKQVIVEQTKFYHQNPTIAYQLLLTISTQILGYAFAGLTRRYLVRPPSMIWPGVLMSTAMFTTMHKSENKTANGWRVTRYKFFIYVWIGAFIWYFLPGLVFPALSYFNVITWFAPNSVVIANLFGTASGLGLFPMTFDWAMIAFIGSPLLTPWWAAANVVGGLVIIMWIVAPLLYYSNALYSSFMPILSSSVFDNTGKPYDVSRILTSDFLFDKEAYLKYSPVYLPITYVLSYTAQFASLSALVMHTICWHGKDIWQQTKLSFAESQEDQKVGYQPVWQGSSDNKGAAPGLSAGKASGDPEHEVAMGHSDVHSRLMKRYEDVPAGWYLVTFISMLAIGIFVVEHYPEVHLPWYGLLLALAITTLLFVPVGIVMAITNQHSSLYLVCQLICGLVFPGRPVANMIFVTYCYISSAQGIKFSSDLKLGHYMKIPPKQLFAVQMAATLVSSVTQIAVLNWMFVSVPGICTPEAINGFVCPIARVHFNGSILWGVVGPKRFFGEGALYRHLVWAFLVGAVAPVAIWLLARKERQSVWRKVNLPVVFGSLSWIPPATGLNFSVWALVCFLFNYVVRRRAFAWWGKYTMTMSAALDSGLAFAVVVVFFGFIYPGWTKNFHWWGTEVYKQGCDWQACSYKTVPPGEHFGPP